jgi:hypothetical protein
VRPHERGDEPSRPQTLVAAIKAGLLFGKQSVLDVDQVYDRFEDTVLSIGPDQELTVDRHDFFAQRAMIRRSILDGLRHLNPSMLPAIDFREQRAYLRIER